MFKRIATTLIIVLGIGLGSVARADFVEVTATGTVDFNLISSGELAGVNAGDAVTLTFLLDVDDFLDSAMFPTRGYVIDPASFDLSIGAATLDLANPFPGTPYFVIRNDDPAVDGFFIGTSPDGFEGVPTDEPGIFGDFGFNYLVTYGNDPLPSLDILDATGTYDFNGLTVFSFGISDGPVDALGIVFEEMTITAIVVNGIPTPASLWLFAPLLLVLAGFVRRGKPA